MKYIILLLSFNVLADTEYLDENKCFVIQLAERVSVECRNFKMGNEIAEVQKENTDIEILDVDLEKKQAVVNQAKKAAKIAKEEAAFQEKEERATKEQILKEEVLSKVKRFGSLTPNEKDKLLEELIKKQFASELSLPELEKKSVRE